MNSFHLNSHYKKILADKLSPVQVYLKIRDHYAQSILLESSDYHGDTDIHSYICIDSISSFITDEKNTEIKFPDGTSQNFELHSEVQNNLHAYSKSFTATKTDLPFVHAGLFGYMLYDSVRYFEDIKIKDFENDDRKIPHIQYHLYRYVLVFNHFNSELYIVENYLNNEPKGLEVIEKIILTNKGSEFPFNILSEEESNFTDDEFVNVLQKGKNHCFRGDVFQIVLSRRFERKYSGDEFQIYRSLRSINPSPYLIYFDYGNFKILGSSPEAQIVIKNGKSTIFPIAGTFRRTGNDIHDYDLARKLLDDPKENAEHVMLVDLARNDLSRHCEKVKVETFKEVQYYSHVIHLVSKVSGMLENTEKSFDIVADTFPAGTLSGAPKYRAMQLINEYEKGNRGFYGGCIGMMDLEGNFNHAIMIRSLLAKNGCLYYQAGAGVVALSDTQSELQEVNNKLAAIRKAIELAPNL